METIAVKRCTRCSAEKPATREFFYGAKTGKDGLHPYCKKCFVEKQRERRQANPEDVSQVRQAFWQRHKERLNEEQRERYHRRMAEDAEWAEKERQRLKEKSREERRESPERVAQRLANYRARHPERLKERQRETMRKAYARDPEKFKARAAKQRAQRLEIPGEFTSMDVNAVFRKQEGKCHYCGSKIIWRQTRWEIDHFIPVSRGGTNDPSNIVIACLPCNRSKHDKLPHEFMPEKFSPPV